MPAGREVCLQQACLACRIAKVSAKDGKRNSQTTRCAVRDPGRLDFTSHQRELLSDLLLYDAHTVDPGLCAPRLARPVPPAASTQKIIRGESSQRSPYKHPLTIRGLQKTGGLIGASRHTLSRPNVRVMTSNDRNKDRSSVPFSDSVMQTCVLLCTSSAHHLMSRFLLCKLQMVLLHALAKTFVGIPKRYHLVASPFQNMRHYCL